MTEPETPAPTIVPEVPHVARVWNYFLGGKDHYDIDRQVGEQTRELMPEVVTLAKQSRAYLTRAVAYLASVGIDQFLDIGTGLPTQENTHEIAQRTRPEARIMYVDNDPLVLAHARALLTSSDEGACDYIHADLRDPEHILTKADDGFLDFARPIAITLMGILEFIPDQAQAVEIVDCLRSRLVPGSYIALYATTDHVNGPRVREAVRLWNESAPAPMTIRSVQQIAELMRGLRLVEPGLVPLHQWRPIHPDLIGDPVDAYAAVGIVPARGC